MSYAGGYNPQSCPSQKLLQEIVDESKTIHPWKDGALTY